MASPNDLRLKRFPVVERERIGADTKRLGWLMVAYHRFHPEADVLIRIGLEPPLENPVEPAA